MRFQLNQTIHFGYLRTPGIHEDINATDAAMLEMGGYGVRLPDQPVVVTPEVSSAPAPAADPEVPHVEPLPLGTGSDGPADRPSDPAPVASPAPEKAPATHKRRSVKR